MWLDPSDPNADPTYIRTRERERDRQTDRQREERRHRHRAREHDVVDVASFTYHGQLLLLAVQWGVAIEVGRAIKKSASF